MPVTVVLAVGLDSWLISLHNEPLEIPGIRHGSGPFRPGSDRSFQNG